MILVIGDEEVANNMVALRDRRSREQSNITKDAFFDMIKQIQEKAKI